MDAHECWEFSAYFVDGKPDTRIEELVMPTEIKIMCKPDSDIAGKLRTLLCYESVTKHPPSYNPLTQTNFNKWIDDLAQAAFDEGLRFKYPVR